MGLSYGLEIRSVDLEFRFLINDFRLEIDIEIDIEIMCCEL